MMNDREKSHSAIVAAKPANKADATSVADAAEPVEPRPGTKRNAGEQSTHRTLGRARVKQALNRVRQAARQRKEEKFTALFHHLSVDLFREAFFALKRDAAPGVDRLEWRTYEADLGPSLTPSKTKRINHRRLRVRARSLDAVMGPGSRESGKAGGCSPHRMANRGPWMRPGPRHRDTGEQPWSIMQELMCLWN
jgi:hypothetical protein